MNREELIEELILELSLVSDKGLPDLRDRKNISFIREFFRKKSLTEMGEVVIQNLFEEDKQFKNPALNKVIKYKNTKGEDAEGLVGNLLRRPKEEDAYIKAVAALGGEGSDTYKKAMDDLGSEGQPNRDIEKEREKGDGGETGGEEPQPQTPSAFDKNTKGGRTYLEDLPDGDPARINKKVYPVGNGYYSDTPNGDPKYKIIDELTEDIITVDTEKKDNVKMQVLGDIEAEKVKDSVVNVTPLDLKIDVRLKALSQLNLPKYKDSILDDNLKQIISTSLQKMTKGEPLTDEELSVAKDYIKVAKTDKKVKIYIATKVKGDWPQQGYVKVELGSGQAAKKWADEVKDSYDITVGASSQGAIGKKQISPAKSNPNRKTANIEIINDDTIVFNGKEMKKLELMPIDELKQKIKSENPDISDKDLNKRAELLEKRIKRYNDNIDSFKEISEESGGKFEYVDYGDVDTTENRSKVIQNMVDITLADFRKRLGDSASLPQNKLVLDTMESLKQFQNTNLESDVDSREKYERVLSDLIVHMTNSTDFRDGVADFAEQKVAMELLGRGFPVYLPSDEAFKTADVLVANPVEFNSNSETQNISDKSNSLQLLYVTLEFAGGISVKYQGGGAGNSDEKVKKTRFKNNETRRRINGMLSTYDDMYPDSRTPPNYPPSQQRLDELKSIHDDNKKWALESGIATSEQLNIADEWADKRIDAVFKTFSSNGVGDCMNDDEKSRFKENMRMYYKNQKLMEVIYNNDADYTLFGNSNQKIKVSRGKAVANVSDVADGVSDVCYMKIKDDVGFSYSMQDKCTVVKPSNRNPSEIHSSKPVIKV